MKVNKFDVATVALMLAVSGVAHAQDALVNGEVKKIDGAAGKITLKHGPIKSLDMDEGMTMVFRIKDADMLQGVKVGDHVRFEVQRAPGGLTVVRMQKVK